MPSISRRSPSGRVAHAAHDTAGARADARAHANHPDGNSERARHAVAWLLSIAAHGFVFLTVLYMFHPFEAPPPNPERLIYIEPAPPPPPLAADGGGESPAVERPSEPEKLVELAAAAPTVKPTVHRSPKPTARPTRHEAVHPQPARDTVVLGDAGGQAEGVAGGIRGGQIGGTVGGHGDAPIAAELAASPPQVLSRVMPEYPTAARLQRVEGQVLLRAVVDRGGQVEEHVVVARSVPLLDDAAVAALRQWRFIPGRDRDGRTVRVQIEVPMRFQLR
jgi:protein TonB